MKPITEDIAKRIIHLCSFGIPKGLGKPEQGQMCIEAIVSNALGEEHSDIPSCVHPEVRKAKVSLNDCNWSSNEARAKGMVKLGIAQLGSISFKDGKFFNKLKLNSIKRILPFLIQIQIDDKNDTKDKLKLAQYQEKFKNLVELDNNLWKEFYDYNNNNNNNSYNYYNYYNYYYNNNYNYYNYCYYNNYYYNNNYYYYNYNLGDIFLLLIADTILQTLIELNCEGCKYLHLIKD